MPSRTSISRPAYCPGCKEYRAPKDWPKANRTTCSRCVARKQGTRRRKAKRSNRSQTLSRLRDKLDDAASADKCLSFLELFAAEQNTDLPGLAKSMARFLKDEDASPTEKRKVWQSALHVLAVAEKARIATATQNETPEEILRRLHKHRQLLGPLKTLLDDGTLTLDDIDPPPPAQ